MARLFFDLSGVSISLMKSLPQQQRISAGIAGLLAVCGSVSGVGEADVSTEDLAFFENRIRPALIKHCYECHSEEADKRKGGLWLDRKEGWELGGDSGPAAIPWDLDKSLLIETIRYHDPDLEMPPDGKLPDSVIADFEEWVRRGLPDPRVGKGMERDTGGMTLEEGREFWSFRPRAKDFGDRESIDDFINARLAGAGIDPEPSASELQRLRRAKIDLTGLIPTLEEQEKFSKNPGREKWEELLDRWLAGDAFGETWGRHWLDLARYADSSGGGRAMPLHEAWRFRDFVIDAFREDRPLDELIVSHIAGDLLPYETLEERSRNLTATGFLVLGPHNYENQNKAELEFEIVDEQLDTISRSFLGQSFGCARCHDHKFDPIPTRDYYAMAGIFLSTNFVTHANVSKWHTEPIPPTKEAQEAIRRHETAKKDLSGTVAGLKKQLASLGRGAGGDMRNVDPASLPGIVIDNVDAKREGEWQTSTSTGRWVGAGYIHDLNQHHLPKSITFEAAIPEDGRYELRVSYAAGSNRNPKAPVEVIAGNKKEIKLINQQVDPEHDKLFETVGVYSLKKGDPAVVVVRNQSGANGHIIADAVQWLPLDQKVEDALAREIDSKKAARIAELEKELAERERELKALNKDAPSIPIAMCVVDNPKETIADTELRIRGVESNRGEPVPRGFLEVASWEGAPEVSPDSSGRLEFAQWVTDPRHPLTARVLANRIWLKLMGEGLVRTVDNFGVTGEEPTHPELLDFLANRLIELDWSAKGLIREIMLSDVYVRSTGSRADARAELDPENKLYWRAHLRPLPAEALRDGMLTLSGKLDESGGGPSLPPGFKSEFGYEFKTLRRSVYVPVFRNSGHELFSVFDFANPNFAVGKRSRSTIPTQALYLTNNPFVHKKAAGAARILLEEDLPNDDARVDLAFRRTLGRPPTASEQSLSRSFLEESGETDSENVPAAWEALQRALFSSVDFRFLR
ncbi:MAG: DUF1553 domain-containing protein [Verrucomicrobiales bacterium]|nr:DUF1553 domain-containing protein [Verrucomicrobiales bacterium]